MALGLPSVFKVLPYTNVKEACAEVGRAIETLRKPPGSC
jgi:hypothetical protein